MNERLTIEAIATDFLIIGGGTAGCAAALSFCESSASGSVLIAEKAHIKRSGCLAAGVNALNAYIVPGKTPESYVDYARADAEGIVREDLLITMARGLNAAAEKLEALGLTMLKNPDGTYAARGTRNIKINGENIKPLLAAAVESQPRVTVLNHVAVIDYIVRDDRVIGAYAIDLLKPVLYVLTASATLCATGGASGLYKPNNPGFSRHKMWYPPFNTGAGYAMGIRAGAEMTTLEMRFIALRCKDTIAPTGTLAQGVGARQVNASGEIYEQKYGITTSQRVHGTVTENREGRGPCALKTVGITAEHDEQLQRAYLNMAPLQTLRWLESGETPSVRNVEIEGTEPYIVGGHTASGYWVSTERETTLKALFAAGDVAGGAPQKYVTGALAEGEIVGKAALRYTASPPPAADLAEAESLRVALEQTLRRSDANDTTDALEAEMQSVMDEYAGGISADYRFSESSLAVADEKIREIARRAEVLAAADTRELAYIFELRERLTLARSVIAHLRARRETRWHSFAENTDYPERDDANFSVFVNSRLENGELKMIFRDLVKVGETYEH
ncbi:MAG: adenylyl-sulfate reductase subunit alpha [Oscillospiraceae bacterium]|jgi:adenylylsulfate reductase subunit A|nr:adenylyl-sulfate reductase subunit alpha [Oscillospiraceae bacterium]